MVHGMLVLFLAARLIPWIGNDNWGRGSVAEVEDVFRGGASLIVHRDRLLLPSLTFTARSQKTWTNPALHRLKRPFAENC